MKEYLKRYGIKTIDAHEMNYGGEEFSIPKPKTKRLAVMVDFAHGKPMMHIHTDHHDKQSGVSKGTSTAFVHEPSNAAFISQRLSPNDLFPPADVKIISTVDSADFASQGITPDDIMRAVYKINPKLDVEKNRRAMGFATNALVLAYKNKPGFLSNLVLQAKPSLLSIYLITKKLAKENGYKPPEEVYQGKLDYAEIQKGKIIKGTINDIKKLGSGQHIMIGNTLVQYGGGSMSKGYDRYTPFKNNPDAEYLIIGWPMGLIQVSANPFKKRNDKIHLGDLVLKKIMPKHKSYLQSKEISLGKIKEIFERDIKSENMFKATGFTFKDAMALFGKEMKKLEGSERWENMLNDIANKPYKKLSMKQKEILDKPTISIWDLIITQSGGHPSITNLSGLNFLGKGYTDFMKKVMVDIAKEMKNI